MNIDESFDAALRTGNPLQALRELVRNCSANGRTPEDILAIFEAQRSRLRSAGREVDEDTITDVMDFIVGWCSPHMKLLDPSATVAQSPR